MRGLSALHNEHRYTRVYKIDINCVFNPVKNLAIV